VSQLPTEHDAEEIYQQAVQAERSHHFDEAERLYRRFAELSPQDPRGPNKIGVILAVRGELDAADAAFRQALSLDPKYAPALTNSGNIRLEHDQLEEAVALYEQALTYAPDYGPAHNNLAAALKRLRRYRPMVQHLKHAQRVERRTDRERARNEVKGCSFRGGTTTILLVVVGLLPFGVFWR